MMEIYLITRGQVIPGLCTGLFSQKLFKQISMLFILLIYLVEKEHKNLYIIIFVHNENAIHLAITEKRIYTTKELEMIG